MRVRALSFDDRTPDSGPFAYAIRSPFLTPEAVSAVAYARRSRQPVWLSGGPGSGAYEVARALHREGESLSFVSLRLPLPDTRDLESRLRAVLEDDFASELVTLYAERIERLAPAVQERLLRYSDEGSHWQGRVVPVRLIAQSDSGARAQEILPALRAKLSALAVPLAPLSARRGEIAEIAAAIAERIAAELGIPGARLPEVTLRQLAERDWPRNLDELTAAIARALFSRDEPGRETEAPKGVPQPPMPVAAAPRASEMAAGGSSSIVAPLRPAVRTVSTPRGPTREPLQQREIEQVVAELAHELKNPMVTIKTFGENLDSILGDPSLRDKFSALAREAIDRMDGFLEELLRFSRFAEPERLPVALAQALAAAVRSLSASFKGRVKMNSSAGSHQVRGDEQQLTFALRSVLRGLCREIPDEVSIQVEVTPSGDLLFSSNAAAGAREKAENGPDAERAASGPNSLDFILADALVRRHGGSMRIIRQRTQLQVRLSLPGVEANDDA